MPHVAIRIEGLDLNRLGVVDLEVVAIGQRWDQRELTAFDREVQQHVPRSRR